MSDSPPNQVSLTKNGFFSRTGWLWGDYAWIFVSGLVLWLLITFEQWLSFFLPLRIALAFLFVLLFPGYCLTIALFPAEEDIDGYERAGLSLGFSVASVPILALVLSWLPGGLSLQPILYGEFILILLFSLVGLFRRYRLGIDQSFAIPTHKQIDLWWQTQNRGDKRIYFISAVALLLGVLALAWTFLGPGSKQSYTEFYLLGSEGLAENYPRQATLGQTLSVEMGINNQTGATQTYTVNVVNEGVLIGVAGPITLAAGEETRRPIEFVPQQTGDDVKIEFQLFIDPSTTIHRILKLWMKISPAY